VARYWRLYAAALYRFRRHQLFRFTYEAPTWAALLAFLELPQADLSPSTYKQQTAPIAELLDNAAELEAIAGP